MNQDQVKALLLKLEPEAEEFTVLFSGKASKKVDGLYQPDKREILIHNKNFEDDNPLIYTAIHEFAHHLQFSGAAAPVSTRAHTNDFWNIFHKLLFAAEEKKVYTNVFKRDRRFMELAGKIKEKFLSANGELMKEFGRLLLEARALCLECHASFEDFVDRELGLHRNSAKTIMKVHDMDIAPEIGFENMKIVAGIKDEDDREEAQQAFLDGESPDMVKARFSSKPVAPDRLQHLLSEKERLEKSLERIVVQLAKLERDIDALKNER